MKLPERFVLLIEGEVWRVRSRHIIVPTSLPHLLAQVLSGSTVAADALTPFGLRVTIEVDTDQGDEG